MKKQETECCGKIERGSGISSHVIYGKQTHMDQAITRRIESPRKDPIKMYCDKDISLQMSCSMKEQNILKLIATSYEKKCKRRR
jgi:hypothetical protein